MVSPAATAGLEQILKILESAANKCREENVKTPVLFIDGIDKLAKYDEELCCTLVRVAEKDRTLNLVLVNSENRNYSGYVRKASYST